VFSVGSNTGVQNSYVNAHGFVHDTIAFRTLLCRPLFIGVASTQNSWFPGYAWVIALCPSCHGHIGWLFVRVREDLEPVNFFGLSRERVNRVLKKVQEGSK